MTTGTVPAGSRPRQPFLDDAQVLLCAPTQAWTRRSGNSELPIDGIYHGDTRFVTGVQLSSRPSDRDGGSPSSAGSQPVPGGGLEWIACVSPDAGSQTTQAVLREVDDDTADPRVRLLRRQSVAAGRFVERYEIQSKLPAALTVPLSVAFTFDFAPLQEIKDGRLTASNPQVSVQGDSVRAVLGPAEAQVRFPGAVVRILGSAVQATWVVEVPANGSAHAGWSLDMTDSSMVVAPAPPDWHDLELAENLEPDLRRWVQRAWSDLGALRLTLPGSSDQFFAAGCPWFLTLFGRDAIWTARLILPYRPDMALSTLRVFASLQARDADPYAASAPGKILHEVRSAELSIPGEGVILPAQYYGSVDSTLLWICLLADVWRLGGHDRAVAALIPALRAALHWLTEHGDSNGDLFVDYFDHTASGLQNQGWKDSADSIQWRDGTLADGPLALCEVQGYAYEALLAGAELLDWADSTFGQDLPPSDLGADITPEQLRDHAAALRTKFRQQFWVETAEGRYPAVALDGTGAAVDTLTSNVGHLIGTGILDHDQERHLTALLLHPDMSGGYGIRTLSTKASGYWPLSYHVGSVWTHDTAVCLRGMAKAGLVEQASAVARQLVRAAVSFDYTAPELFCGDSTELTPQATAYPAACRPQAWAAASAVACMEVEQARQAAGD